MTSMSSYSETVNLDKVSLSLASAQQTQLRTNTHINSQALSLPSQNLQDSTLKLIPGPVNGPVRENRKTRCHCEDSHDYKNVNEKIERKFQGSRCIITSQPHLECCRVLQVQNHQSRHDTAVSTGLALYIQNLTVLKEFITSTFATFHTFLQKYIIIFPLSKPFIQLCIPLVHPNIPPPKSVHSITFGSLS